jgi:hypothetical protein
MANSLYSLIQTGINTGKNVNELMESILNIRNQLEKDFRINQQIYRNKKLNINIILNDKTLSLKLMKEKCFNFEKEKEKIKLIFERFRIKTNAIKENLKFINSTITNETDYYDKKTFILNNYLRKNSMIISFAKLIHRIILEENRIPDIKFQLKLNYTDKSSISSAKINYKFIEKIENSIDLAFNYRSQLSENLKKSNISELIKKLENGFFIDQSFLIFEHILNYPSNTLVNDLNANMLKSTTLKERIVNVLLGLINMKEKENFKLKEVLKTYENNKNKLLEKYIKLKNFYLNKSAEFSKELKDKNLIEENLEEKMKLIEKEESLVERSIGSSVEEIKFYRGTYTQDEKKYSELVERTIFFVKAINQIKKYMINNFSNLKDYLLTRKL